MQETIQLKTNKEILNWAKEQRGNKCEKCGYSNPTVLHFHHRDPEKKLFMISKAMGKTLDLIQEELDKCDLVCANCHTEIHATLIVPRRKKIKKKNKHRKNGRPYVILTITYEEMAKILKTTVVNVRKMESRGKFDRENTMSVCRFLVGQEILINARKEKT